MNDKARRCDSKGEFFDFRNDFILLTNGEKRNVLKTARTYWKLLKDNDALLADAKSDPLPMDSGKQKGKQSDPKNP